VHSYAVVSFYKTYFVLYRNLVCKQAASKLNVLQITSFGTVCTLQNEWKTNFSENNFVYYPLPVDVIKQTGKIVQYDAAQEIA
jgi:hypothetical protein